MTSSNENDNTATARKLIADIITCYVALAQIPSLDPSSEVNCLFEKLVHICCQVPAEGVILKVQRLGMSLRVVVNDSVANMKLLGSERLKDC